MSRRLVISILILLIVGVVGGTSFFVYTWWRERNLATNEGEGGLQEAEVVDPTADDDNDGLNNGDERIWGTDPRNPDTDGDGFRDGEEVNANRNPTIAAPNDRLPEGFQPGRDINPLDVAPTEPLPVDQFFVDNLDLDGPDQNLTESYRSRYGEGDRASQTLLDFVQQQTITTQLPTPANRTINVINNSNSTTLQVYLDTAGNLKPLSNKTLLAESLRLLFEEKDPSGFIDLAQSVKNHQNQLVVLRVPAEAVSLQRLLLGYTELLHATFNTVSRYNEDEVKSLVALRQLEEADKKYIPLITQEINRLNGLANTTSN